MSEKKKSNPKYGYKWIKEKVEKESPGLYKLILLLEEEYKHKEIKTITKPCYVLSRLTGVITSHMQTQEKRPEWTMKGTINSFIGGVSCRFKKDKKENGKK